MSQSDLDNERVVILDNSLSDLKLEDLQIEALNYKNGFLIFRNKPIQPTEVTESTETKIQGKKKETKKHTKMTYDNIRIKIKGWFITFLCEIFSELMFSFEEIIPQNKPRRIIFGNWKKNTNKIRIEINKKFLSLPIKEFFLEHLKLERNSPILERLNKIEKMFANFKDIMDITLEDFYQECFIRTNNLFGPELEQVISKYCFQQKLVEENKKNEKNKEYIEKLSELAENFMDYFQNGKQRKMKVQ